MPETDDDYALIHSLLSAELVRDGVTLEVCIYRVEGAPPTGSQRSSIKAATQLYGRMTPRPIRPPRMSY